ncbi:MAG TPA: HAMP domain-containing sensor histidine kinase [Candidatus Binatia bacterium]|jgi:signal transduction histidine kinase|nr:HAMP domain-containing sensor histidine kinase [Candidatus Binatia bacterium]
MSETKPVAPRIRQSYVLVVAGLGLVFALQGILQAGAYERLHIFLLLMALAVLAQFAATGADVTFEVSSAISLATVPFYGPAAAALVATAASVSIWLIKRLESTQWKGSWEQLVFNSGMSSVSVYVAGLIFILCQHLLGTGTTASMFLPWLFAAVVGDQLNVWLLIGILYLQQGIDPLTFWRENGWAMPINMIIMGAGGGVLATAVREFDALGIAIFFLPVFLSAYAFRLYVARTRAHLEQLEDLVAERTGELVDANESLADLNKQKDAFLAVLTHDMRSPLTNIHGYASLLRDHPELPPEQRMHMAEIILRNERALLEIVNNILDIEYLESGAPVLLERQNFDLVELVNDLVDSSQAPAQEKQISLRYDSDAKPIFVHADKQKINRILQNLISNAIKYTPEQGCVQVRAAMNGRYVKVEVQDNGYGIPADDLPLIFDRYSRVAKHKSMAVGTGLGLAIVKSLVEAHEGGIDVVSEEGAGSTFTVKLPT